MTQRAAQAEEPTSGALTALRALLATIALLLLVVADRDLVAIDPYALLSSWLRALVAF